MSVKVEVDAAAAAYVLGLCLARLEARNATKTERELVSHMADALQVGLRVARYAKYMPPNDWPPPIEPAPV